MGPIELARRESSYALGVRLPGREALASTEPGVVAPGDLDGDASVAVLHAASTEPGVVAPGDVPATVPDLAALGASTEPGVVAPGDALAALLLVALDHPSAGPDRARGPVRRAALRSGGVREHVDDRAARILDEEAANAPGLVGERVDDAQPAPDRLIMGGVDGRRIAYVDPEARLGLLHPRRGDEDLRLRVSGRAEPEHRILHGDLEPERLDVEAPRRGDVASVSVGHDPRDGHGGHLTGRGRTTMLSIIRRSDVPV